MTRRERLKVWIESLNNEQKNTLLLGLIDFSIDAEHVGFCDETKVPYYENTGDRLDGVELEE